MNAHERFEEIQVGQLARFGVELAHGERLLEGAVDFGFVLLLHPDEDEVNVAFAQRLLRGFNNRTVQTVAVRLRGIRSEDRRHRMHGEDS